jgi:D-3-phosphoglycerate dehydrogenase
MKRILLTTTSYQDTPGKHHDLLEAEGYEIERRRGPLNEEQMLDLAGDFDAFLCGDDAITAEVIEKSLPRLRLISKYGIGLDKIDMDCATRNKIPVTFCPGVNHTTVAEHTFALLLAICRNLCDEVNHTRKGEWTRLTGNEIMGKTLAVIGFGRIGKEVALRAKAFQMEVKAYDPYWDADFADEHQIRRCASLQEVLQDADVLSLHLNLSENTHKLINSASLKFIKDGAILLNCSRGELVDTLSVVDALKSGKLGGYGSDVLDQEPPPSDHPLLSAPGALITPHIGSRTFESVVRQATMATQNLINVLNGEPALAQANEV